MARKLNIFAVYALVDKDVMLEIASQLEALGSTYDLNIWKDDAVVAGSAWEFHFESRASHTEVFLLLLSKAFMETGFVNQEEFKLIIDRQKNKSSAVIPILLEQCNWDTKVDLGDYQFSPKELQLLPSEAKPIKDWDSAEEAYDDIGIGIKSIIEPFLAQLDQRESKKKKVRTGDPGQVAMSFTAVADKENNMEETNQSQQEISQTAGSREEAEARRRAEVAKRIREAAEASAKKREEEDRLWEEALEKRRLEKARKIREEAALAKQQGTTENGYSQDNAALKNKRAERKKRSRPGKVAQRNKAETKKPQKTAVAPASTTSAKPAAKVEASSSENSEGSSQSTNIFTRKNIIRAAMGGLFVVLIIWLFSLFGSGAESEATEAAATDATEVENSKSTENTTEEAAAVEAPPAFAVGDYHQDGIIFELNLDNKTGKVAHLDDAGPMPWQDANIIHDQLGAGWRLPTIEELQSMYNAIGQGADNKGEFTNGLYWSSTPFEEHQARLLRFLDGNTTYHYNRHVETRSYRVRAIKDFDW